MNESIFRMTKTDNIETKLYCLKGCEDFIDDEGYARSNNETSQDVVAKSVKNKKSKHFGNKNNAAYYIKSNPSLQLYNPIEYACPVKDKDKYNFINSTCKETWSFREVTPQIFDKYITFLNTKNISWLKAAERELK